MRVVARAFDLLRILALGGEQGMRLIDVVTLAKLSRPTVHRILRTLISESVAEQDPQTRRYRVGPEISVLGLSRPAQLPVRVAAEPYLSDLAEELGDTTFLTIRAGWDSVAIARKAGSYPIKVLAIDVGARRPLGVGVAGVMLLAGLSEEEADQICNVNAERLRPDGSSMEAIRIRIRLARANGFAYAESGVLQGTRALAVPVFDPDGEVIAAMAIAAMAHRLAEAELPRLVAALRQKAELISMRLGELKSGRCIRPVKAPGSELGTSKSP